MVDFLRREEEMDAGKSSGKNPVLRWLYRAFERSGTPFPEEIQSLVDQYPASFSETCTRDAFLAKLKAELSRLNMDHVSELLACEERSEQRDTTISCKGTVDEYIDRTDWRVQANANLGYSSVALLNQISGKVIANYWLDRVYPEEAGRAHREGDVHIHDLDCLTGYCAGWSLRMLLNEGFNGVKGHVSSLPPKHFSEALGQIVVFLGTLQTEWAGAQAFSSFDTYLAPYVFRDNLSFVQVKKAIRHFIYNLNTPTRGGQTPFTNITLDFTCPKDLRDQFPTRGNRHLFEDTTDKNVLARVYSRHVSDPKELTYKDFQAEIEMIDIAFYEVMTEGDSQQQPFTFPLPTVNITESFDWESPAARALFENTAKVGSSYFQNFVGSQWVRDENGTRVPNAEAYKPDAVRSMCCRLQLDLRELLKRGNGLFGSAEMTGSIGVVTINMARLGYRFRGDREGMLTELSRIMDLSREVLEKKRDFVQRMHAQGLYPYTRRYLKVGLQNHFSTIGVNGMNEMVQNFTAGAHDISDSQGISIATDILDFMRERLKGYQRETGNLYNLEGTPAESAMYRFAREDKKRYADILQAGNGETPYYTNSSQLPVGFTEDPYLALEKQEGLQCKYTGGTVLHLYLTERASGAEACKKFVRSVITNYRLPSVTVTPVFSTCPTHGYLTGEQKHCPTCGEETLVWTRVMGYYRPVASFNKGKKQEHADRRYFKEPILMLEKGEEGEEAYPCPSLPLDEGFSLG